MMKRVLLITCVLLTVITVSSNARSIKDIFLNAPDDLFAIIDKETRLDLLDYYNAGSTISIQNNLGDDTQFIKVTDDFLSIQLAESSEIEMKMLCFSKKDTIIVVNSTIKSPTPDGKLSFYTADWKPIDAKKHISIPDMKAFISIPKGSDVEIKDVLNQIDFPLISYSIDPATATITAMQNLEQYMSKEEYKRIANYLIPSIKYTLSGKKYRKE
ncbi:MAG: DUF3256 family protein [Muribaculaceae bacterium]